MDPCPYVRVVVGNLALKMPASASTPPRGSAAAGAGVHPTTAPCYCRIRLNSLPYQTATAPLLPSTDDGPASCTGAFAAAAFHLSKPDLDAKPALLFARRRAGAGTARLKVAVYAGRASSSSSSNAGGRLLGKVVLPLDLAGAGALTKPVVFHTGWVPIASSGRRSSHRKPSQQQPQLNLTVRADPDPRFVFQFDGEPERGPQVLQVQGGMRQPMFTCRFSCRSSASDLRSRSAHSDPGGFGGGRSAAAGWLARLGSERGDGGWQRRREQHAQRKGWSVTVHDLSGSPVALASMVTPFVASPGSDRVSRSNPGAWLLMRPVDGTWTPWGRLECWRDRGASGSGGDLLGYRFELLMVPGDGGGACVVAESSLRVSKGGRFAIDLTAAQPQAGSLGCGGGDLGQGLWPLGASRGFVMSATVQGEGRRSRPTVEVGVAHVGCAEDAAAFVALAAAVDLSMDACRLFSCRRLRRELSASRADLFR